MSILSGKDQDAVQRSAWDQVVAIAQRFISADRYLFAVPMWNSGIPYRLKQYIDLIRQPGLLWGLNPDTGYHGLLTDKHATTHVDLWCLWRARRMPASAWTTIQPTCAETGSTKPV